MVGDLIGWLVEAAGYFWQAIQESNLQAPLVTATLAAFVAIFVLRVNLAINIRNKRMDIILHCNNRYDDLYKMRMEIGDDEQPDPKKIASYFRRYWGLKSDQLDYWFAGYIDPETIISWFMFTTSSIRNKSRVGGVGYAQKWQNDKSEHEVVNQRLVEVMDFIINYASRIKNDVHVHAAIMEYMLILEKNERILISQLSRNTPKRLYVNEFSWTMRKDSLPLYDAMDTSSTLSQWISRLNRAYLHTRFMKRPIPRRRSKVRFDQLRAKCQSIIEQEKGL